MDGVEDSPVAVEEMAIAVKDHPRLRLVSHQRLNRVQGLRIAIQPAHHVEGFRG